MAVHRPCTPNLTLKLAPACTLPSPTCPHRANNVFPLFGTLLFGVFAFYLQLAVVKGNFKFGLNLLLFRVHPMRPGATLMSSFLFNVGLILLATTATIQFCAAAFQLYADGTAVLDIFGNQLTSIQVRGWVGTSVEGRWVSVDQTLCMHLHSHDPRAHTHSQGLRYIYTENIFIYCFLAFVALSLAWAAVRGPDRWKRTKVEDAYMM